MALTAAVLHELGTLRVTQTGKVVFATITRPEARNTINHEMVEDFFRVIEHCREHAHVLVVRGSDDYFCFGADFHALESHAPATVGTENALYQLWLDMRQANFIVLAQVAGAANAGGLGFVAASDIVLAAPQATFGLSEMLFGLFPACVLPFLIGRVGRQNAHFLTLSTKAVPAVEAARMGLVDVCADDIEVETKRLLFRLDKIPKSAIAAYKAYMASILPDLGAVRDRAVSANRAMFSDPATRQGITRYVRTGAFPWQP